MPRPRFPCIVAATARNAAPRHGFRFSADYVYMSRHGFGFSADYVYICSLFVSVLGVPVLSHVK